MSSQNTPEKKPDASSASDNEALEAAPAAPSGQVDPQIIVELAIQLLQPKLQDPTYSGRQLSDPEFNDDFLDAIKRSKWMVDIASGRSDETFHAYQLFQEGAAPMSFQAIADRFNEVMREVVTARRLPASKNTVENDMETIIEEAQAQAERRKNALRFPIMNQFGFPISLDQLDQKMRSLVATMMEESKFDKVVENTDQVVGEMAGQFMEFILRRVPELQQIWSPDLKQELVASTRFIPYVCTGLSYSEFMRKDPKKTGGRKRTGGQARLVRPYEAYLFASQSGILNDKYQVKLSDLKDGVYPDPKRRRTMSILCDHRGHLLADEEKND